ncbi:MAG: tRNA lysidine(34) synthetase TilS [Candidatus Electrothrix aestuarii]|uniref:tRNA(Ile)-lysidine synthase n=1 Tax=Candidatus Electrothrix aestuarii TaxID=3062594 RepID=A0AAU8LQW1_9BACT|nr:tRNA lysidine(34) synthetase TilS [Candidatus Electrothrix aestuarii]
MQKKEPLSRTFFRELTDSCLVAQGSRIISAVSGGPDSMALLHLLAAVQQSVGLALTAVWVDHGLRPEETPLEERTVMLAAENLQVACVRHRVDAASYAREQRISLEHAARDLRYAALRTTAREVGAEYIAVAHTADDQAEEVLLRLLRGSGREGLAGMRMRSRGLIRPLLNIEKKDLLAWLTEQEIPFCFDSSNDDMRFLRNRVRHQLLPFLEEHFEEGVKKSLRKTADSLAEDEALLAALTAEAEEKTISALPSSEQSGESLRMQLDRAAFRALHPALQRRVVERLLWKIGGRAGYDHILLVIKAAESGRTNSELHLGKGLRVGVFRDRLEFSYPMGQRAWRGRLFGDA